MSERHRPLFNNHLRIESYENGEVYFECDYCSEVDYSMSITSIFTWSSWLNFEELKEKIKEFEGRHIECEPRNKERKND